MAIHQRPTDKVNRERREMGFECAQQLHEQWPRVDRSDLANLAEALWKEPRWQSMERSAAALEWLRQGIPSVPHAPAVSSR
jgi:hypothetical protein